jgi:hypothetical protein
MHDFRGHDGEAIMQDMINEEVDYTQAEADPEPGQHGYDIGSEPLFSTACMSMEERMTSATLTATLSSCFPEGKNISQRTASYTTAEGKVLCDWLEISTDPMYGAKQKGFNVTSQDVRLEIERKELCVLHSCIENLGNFRAFNKTCQSD